MLNILVTSKISIKTWIVHLINTQIESNQQAKKIILRLINYKLVHNQWISFSICFKIKLLFYQIQQVGHTPNITFKVTEESAGRYLCKAEVLGFPIISSEATVYLKRPPIIESNERQFGRPGDNVRIECQAFSVPKARHVSWTFNGREINTSNDQDYSILEDPLPEGIKSTLIISESQSKHFGRYNCTVVNDFGNDTKEIDLIAQSKFFGCSWDFCSIFNNYFFITENIPLLLIIVAVVLVGIIVLIILFAVMFLKRGKKKLPPADVIPEVFIFIQQICYLIFHIFKFYIFFSFFSITFQKKDVRKAIDHQT